jgi:hypothetical protein
MASSRAPSIGSRASWRAGTAGVGVRPLDQPWGPLQPPPATARCRVAPLARWVALVLPAERARALRTRSSIGGVTGDGLDMHRPV